MVVLAGATVLSGVASVYGEFAIREGETWPGGG
jgi:hypothetical protein